VWRRVPSTEAWLARRPSRPCRSQDGSLESRWSMPSCTFAMKGIVPQSPIRGTRQEPSLAKEVVAAIIGNDPSTSRGHSLIFLPSPGRFSSVTGLPDVHPPLDALPRGRGGERLMHETTPGGNSSRQGGASDGISSANSDARGVCFSWRRRLW